VTERVAATGEVLTPLDEQSVINAARRLTDAGIRSIAVALLHAYKNPSHEIACERLLAALFPDVHVSLSHRIANEWREYERTSTTVVNAAVAPILSEYLNTLEARLKAEGVGSRVHVMQSNGGITTADRARVQAVNTLLSGPVGGAIATARLASAIGQLNAIGIDMGGTSFDVSLSLEGEPQIAREAKIEGQPLILPIVDVHTIGAGGGSIAWESAGGLRVGPQSAGAVPGPACYARGGVEPTVTDANVHLGRVNPDYFLGGKMKLRAGLAREALDGLATRLKLSPERLAEGILDVVNTRMASLIRNLTVGRGLDPRTFTLVAFGGAGPMHAAFLADELGITNIVVPHSPGTFSAQGMLRTDIRHDLVAAHYARWIEIDDGAVTREFRQLQTQGKAMLHEDGISNRASTYLKSADLRYVGQEHYLTLPVNKFDSRLLKRFHRVYRETFGHSKPDDMVEVVNLRLTALGTRQDQPAAGRLPDRHAAEPYASGLVRFQNAVETTPRYRREELAARQRIDSPCVIDEESCTTVVPRGWTVDVDPSGVMFLRHP
jgi:N-methylhydantoinase A